MASFPFPEHTYSTNLKQYLGLERGRGGQKEQEMEGLGNNTNSGKQERMKQGSGARLREEGRELVNWEWNKGSREASKQGKGRGGGGEHGKQGRRKQGSRARGLEYHDIGERAKSCIKGRGQGSR